jgi:hypothetical protein
LLRIIHLLNPVKVTNHTDLFNYQYITFESLLRAQKQCNTNIAVRLCTTQYEEDKSIIPAEFNVLSNLQRAVSDVNTQLTGKKLPLIADVLNKLPEAGETDYYIYTNMDIAVMPFFYDAVHQYVLKGHDAIVINRRRISNRFKRVEDLPEMYAELGKSHPGFDCFILKKELLNQFIFGDICVGMPFIEAAFVHNICAFASNPLFVMDAHLTFHIGMEVMPARNNSYYWHNRNAFFKTVYPVLKPHFKLSKFPYAALPLHLRALKWVLNPSLFTRNYLQLEVQGVGNKIKYLLNEIRWRILQR